jgi:cytochrome c553
MSAANPMLKSAAAVLALLLAGCGLSPESGLNAAHGRRALAPETAAALALDGDARRGRVAYEVCQGCHRPDGSGRVDGSYPELAGQHARVIIKQLTDIRSGERPNPKMAPFASRHVIDVGDIADIAAYLEALPIAYVNGRGPGDDLARGRQLYEHDCRRCHGARGEGDASRFYPVLAGQHFLYLARQLKAIRSGERGNADPEMERLARGYTERDIEAVSDYISRLIWTRGAAAK